RVPMKRTLLLMRHAQAEPGFGIDDIDRPLTAQGQAQAKVVGRLLAQHGCRIDHVVCSTALRTRQTLDGVLSTLGAESPPEIEYNEAAYNAASDTLLELVQYADEDIETMMVVGHNPSISQLVFDFVAGSESLTGFPPATVAEVQLDVEWLYAAPGTGTGHILNGWDRTSTRLNSSHVSISY